MSKLMDAITYRRDAKEVFVKELLIQPELYVAVDVHTACIEKDLELYYESVVVKQLTGVSRTEQDKILLKTFAPITADFVFFQALVRGKFHSVWIPHDEDTLRILGERVQDFLYHYQVNRYLPKIIRNPSGST